MQDSRCSGEVKYLTDGSRLFEVEDEYVVRNSGLGGTFIRGAFLRDVKSGEQLVYSSRLLNLKAVS